MKTSRHRTAAGLTPKQAAFVREYLIDHNGAQAAIRAGFAKPSARVTAAQLLAKPNIAAAVAAREQKVEKKLDVTVEQIGRELMRCGFANMLDYMRAGPGGDPYLDFSKLTRAQAGALAEVTVEDYVDGRGEAARDVKRVKFKLVDKRAALVDLAKLLGYWKERHEHSGKLTLEEALARAGERLSERRAAKR